MKPIIALSILSICLFLAYPFNVAHAQKITGSGQVIEQDRNLSGFDKIFVKNGIDVHIRQGKTESVMVKADDNLVDYIKTDVEDGTLKIYSESGYGIHRSKAFDVYVTVNNLTEIRAKHGSDVYGKSAFELDELKIYCSSGSDLEMDIQATTLHCKLTGGSDAKLTGKVKTLLVEAKGGSDLMAKKLASYKCEVHAYGGSDAYVRVEDELNAQAFGSSDIHYYGNPNLVHSKAKGGSDIYEN